MVFSAVAVTPTTRGLVAAMAVLPVAMVAWLVNAQNVSDIGAFAAVLAYATVALGGSALFHRASRIAVGLDGVLVTGAGRRRFLPWAAIGHVRVDGISIVIEAANRARELARLQPHGEDAARRDALARRFRDMQEAARMARSEAAHVHAAHAVRAIDAGDERLADAMRGATSYRDAAVTREQLWRVEEGPAANPAERALAAEALAHGLDRTERARLRVATDHCADPEARASLEALLDEEARHDEAEAITLTVPLP
jgi:hypothetical protein